MNSLSSVCVKPAAVVDVTNFNCQVQWIEKDGKKNLRKKQKQNLSRGISTFPLRCLFSCFSTKSRERVFSNIVKVFAVPLHLKIQQPNKKCSLKKLWKFCFEFFGTGKKRRIHDTFFSKLIFSFQGWRTSIKRRAAIVFSETWKNIYIYQLIKFFEKKNNNNNNNNNPFLLLSSKNFCAKKWNS